MSYDLFFHETAGGRSLSFEAFEAYFASRPLYAIENGQAFYENSETGVYFSFSVGDEPGSASFNLNYFRPHTFALEAEPEVRAFVHQFGADIDDPQMDGMDRGPYSAEGFLRGWHAGNRTAYAAVVAQQRREGQPMNFPTLPWAEIERIWTWNVQRGALQERVGEYVFVPRIMLLDGPRTYVVWRDDVDQIVLPRVDEIVALRTHTVPPHAPEFERIAHIPWHEIERAIGGAPRDVMGIRLAWNEPIAQAFRAARPPAVKPQGLGFDTILDLEILDAVARG